MTKINELNLIIEKDQLLLKELIIQLSNKYGSEFKKYVLTENKNKIRPYIIILINEISVDLLNNLNTILKNNDIITFLPSIHGGN
ncbi:MAG: MoaD/ThiS family protein [Candidatus Helarchaeota archaeon]|nr:MoaD/ThiS family protein [Candidatus Helarchaeota archaeon]